MEVALDGRADLLPLWFSTLLHHSLVDTVTERYHSFSEIAVAALRMVAEANDIKLRENDAHLALTTALQNLRAHHDVEEGLRSLKQQGFRLVTFTNSSNEGARHQLENAGIASYFEKSLSVEGCKIYKPALASYQWALKEVGATAEETMMVAAHGWDIAGIKAVGMSGVFMSRPGKVIYPLAISADKQVPSLKALAEWLLTIS